MQAMVVSVMQTAELLFSEFRDEVDRDRIKHALITAYRYHEEKQIEKRVKYLDEQLGMCCRSIQAN